MPMTYCRYLLSIYEYPTISCEIVLPFREKFFTVISVSFNIIKLLLNRCNIDEKGV